MSNALTVFDLGSSITVPDYITGAPAIVGKLASGDARNRISLLGREFHIIKGGVEEGVLDTRHCDVILVGAVPYVSRQYYASAWDPNNPTPPTCYSVDGKTPNADVKDKQSDKCNTCQWNEKGSALAGNEKARACGFFRRLAVVLVGDPTYTIYQLDLKSKSLWNDGIPKENAYSFTEYAKKLQAHSIDAGTVITRLRFNSDSVPVLVFQAVGFASKDDLTKVVSLVNEGEVGKVLEISMSTVDLGHEVRPSQEPATAAPKANPVEDTPTLKPSPVAVQSTAPRITPAPSKPAPVRTASTTPPKQAALPLPPASVKAAPRPSPEETQQDVDALLAELEG